MIRLVSSKNRMFHRIFEVVEIRKFLIENSKCKKKYKLENKQTKFPFILRLFRLFVDVSALKILFTHL